MACEKDCRNCEKIPNLDHKNHDRIVLGCGVVINKIPKKNKLPDGEFIKILNQSRSD